MSFPIWSFEAEVDEARLVGMERKLVPSERLPRRLGPAGRRGSPRKHHHGIVGVSDKGISPLKAWLHLVLEPLIQHVVQEDIR